LCSLFSRRASWGPPAVGLAPRGVASAPQTEARPPLLSPAGLLAWAPSTEEPIAPHLLLGVSPAHLRELCVAHNIRAADATQKLADVVIRRTARSRMSLAEDLAKANTLTSIGRPAIAPATLVVVHAHACSFVKLLDAVDAYLTLCKIDPETAYLWVDVVCVRHHRVPVEVAQVGRVQRAVGSVVCVLDPPEAPLCLKRSWCLFELAHAELSEDVKLGLAFAPPPAAVPPGGDSAAEIVDSSERALQALAVGLAQLGSHETSASTPKDRDAIFARVESAFGADGDGNAYARYDELLKFALRTAMDRASFAPLRPPETMLTREMPRRMSET